MSDSLPGSGSDTAHSRERRLEGWGEIALYFNKEIRTVQRWEERYGLPVHRFSPGKGPSVYAFPSELARWYEERRLKVEKDIKDEPERPPSETAPPPDSPQEPETPEPSSNRNALRRRRRLRQLLWGIAILAVLIGVFDLAIWILYPPKSQDARTAALRSFSADSRTRIFVRPFKTSSADPGQDSFAQGLTAEIITTIGQIDPQRFAVIAPTSAMHFGDKTIAELASELHINYVVEGFVQHSGNQVRINALLISANDEANVWSASFDEDITDILKVQADVAEAVGQKISANLGPTASATLAKNLETPPGPIDPAGYRAYVQGRRFWTFRDLEHSVAAFKTAVQLMPNYAMAHSGLAAALAVLGETPNDGVPATVSAPQATAEAKRALELDPKNAEAHYVLGNIAMSYEWDFPKAQREFEEAIRLEPNNATAHQWLGQYYMVQGRINDAQAETAKALDMDPVSPIFTTAQAEAYYYAHQYDDTIASSNLTLEHSPTFVLAEFWLGSAYREKRMYPEAIQHFKKASAVLPDNAALPMAYGYALAVSGDANGAKNVLVQLEALSHSRNVPAIYFAGIYTGLGQKDQAFQWLDKAVQQRNDRLIYLGVDPIAGPLRSDARFNRLLKRINLR